MRRLKKEQATAEEKKRRKEAILMTRAIWAAWFITIFQNGKKNTSELPNFKKNTGKTKWIYIMLWEDVKISTLRIFWSLEAPGVPRILSCKVFILLLRRDSTTVGLWVILTVTQLASCFPHCYLVIWNEFATIQWIQFCGKIWVF